MKRIVVIAALFLFAIPCSSVALPVGVNVVSENYHIWGSGSGLQGYDPNIEPFSMYYDYTASIPLQEIIIASSGDYFESCADRLFVESNTVAVGKFFIGESPDLFLRSESFAEYTLTFNATANIDFSAIVSGNETSAYWDARIIINNLSTPSVIWDSGIVVEHGFGTFFFSPELYFNPNHLYSLSLYVRSDACDDGQHVFVQGDFFSVPEPSTMLLLGAGLVGLVGVRRKLKK